MSIKPLSPTLPQGAYTHRSKDEQVRRCPPLWKCNKRREAIEQRIERVQAAFQTVNEDLPSDPLKQCADSIKAVQLGTIQETILKVANVVSKIFCFIFHIKFHQIDALLRSNKDARRIYRDLTDILRPVSVGDLDFVAETVDSKYDKNLRLVLFSYKIKKVRDSLYHFEQQLSQEGATNAELFEAYNSLPPVLKRSLQEILRSHYQDIDSKVSIQKLIKSNPRVFLSLTKNNKNAIKQLVEYFDEAIAVHKGAVNRKAGVPSGCGKDSSVEVGGKDAQPDAQLISVHDFLRNLTPQNPSGKFSIYDISFDKVCRELKKEVSEEPITVTMVGVEFANLVKVGGLAEALEGLSQGMRALNPNNRVKLVFPLFSTLPEEVKQLIEKTPSVTYQSSKGESFSVTTVDFNGVECSFIEHPEFELEEEDPNIYGPDWETQATRFATFSELAADLIYRKKDTDIIHLHDWHVAGVALKLKREHKEEWKSGQIPPVVFTFHNNSRASQGRICGGPYCYDAVVEGYRRRGILGKNENLFVKTLLSACDVVTTVSERFGQEAQRVEEGEGVSFAVRRVAKAGKLVGIVNGTDQQRWDPETDKALKSWRDVETQEPLDLTYSSSSEDILSRRMESKKQLQKWVKKYSPDFELDPNKPFVTYIGRFDSYQKGIDTFEKAIETTLRNGGQFICMGAREDERATEILDKLEKKYRNTKGVLFIRDYKDSNGRFHWQQGDDDRPGCGSLVRAASDFLFIPSKFEPCGLVQFEGWNYGSLVLGANTGGLADTVVPIEENDGVLKGNGFLFERKRGSPNEFEHVIGKALRFWKQLDSAAQQKLVSRVMEEGRQYSWKTSPNGLSPSVKYRCVYELAKREVGMRRASLDEHFSVECLKRKISVQGCAEGTSRKSRAEEKYMQKYYSEKGVTDPEELERLFLAIPQSSRKDFPSPYGRGVDYRQYERQGAFYNKGESQFTVFAPNAEDVKVVFYDDNEELLGTHSMSKQPNGEWKVTVNDNAIKPGVRYHYQVNNKCKLDPYGRMQRASKDPNKDPYSVLVDSQHTWNDGQWMAKRADSAGQSKPMSVYEIHPMTWKKKDGKPLNYRKLAEELVAHCQDQGYTHIELMGILEHPYEGSWGYQVTGYFSPTSRMGTPDDFKYMIDYLHRHNIGVIVDWVPAHFAKDKSGLGEFDGSPLYEATGIRHFFSIRNLVFNWGKHFDFRKKAVREFLASSAYFWLKEMHVDGLRVDAVRSVLSSEDSSSSRKFLKDLNAIVHKRCDGAFTVAEDYSGDTRLTLTPFDQGLDFNMKWHIGWTRKTLNFFRSPLEQRCANYKSLVAAVGCDNFHRQMMVISHDHVKGEMKGFAAGTSSEEKFANLRSALSFMMCQPGKKLLCMGTELGGSRGWDTYVGQTRGLFDNQNEISSEDRQTMKMLKALNEIYKSEKAFSEFDDNEHDLEWIEKNDPNKRVLAYRRTSSEGDSFACFHNFTSEEARTFKVRTMDNVSLEEIFSSDDQDFGGKGRKNTNIQIKSDEKGFYYEITIPPLSTVIIKETSAWEFDNNGDGFEWIKKKTSKKRAFAYRQKRPGGDRFACCYNLFSKRTKKLKVRTDGNVLPQIVYSRSCKGLRKEKKETCKVEAGSDKKGDFYVVTLPPLSAVVLKEKKTKKK